MWGANLSQTLRCPAYLLRQDVDEEIKCSESCHEGSYEKNGPFLTFHIATHTDQSTAWTTPLVFCALIKRHISVRAASSHVVSHQPSTWDKYCRSSSGFHKMSSKTITLAVFSSALMIHATGCLYIMYSNWLTSSHTTHLNIYSFEHRIIDERWQFCSAVLGTTHWHINLHPSAQMIALCIVRQIRHDV